MKAWSNRSLPARNSGGGHSDSSLLEYTASGATKSTESVERIEGVEESSEADSSEQEETLSAKLSPWSGDTKESGAVDVTVYVVTGYHGKLRVPESFCRECHMFTRRAQLASEEVPVDVNITVRSWWTHFPWALRHGGYHPPVMIVGGSMLCQGHDVPTSEEVVDAILAAQENADQ